MKAHGIGKLFTRPLRPPLANRPKLSLWKNCEKRATVSSRWSRRRTVESRVMFCCPGWTRRFRRWRSPPYRSFRQGSGRGLGQPWFRELSPAPTARAGPPSSFWAIRNTTSGSALKRSWQPVLHLRTPDAILWCSVYCHRSRLQPASCATRRHSPLSIEADGHRSRTFNRTLAGKWLGRGNGRNKQFDGSVRFKRVAPGGYPWKMGKR